MNELKAECTTRNCSALDEKSVGKSRSLFSRNEPGNTGLHNGIKPYSRLDSIADLPHGALLGQEQQAKKTPVPGHSSGSRSYFTARSSNRTCIYGRLWSDTTNRAL